jgi:SAM-dependent methyltransferase
MSKYDYFLTKKTSLLGQMTGASLRKRLFSIIKKFIEKKCTIIEIGPGKGFFTEWCINNNHTYICYDNNQNILDHAIKLGAKGHLGSVPPLKEADESVDLILLSHVFEHMLDYEKAYTLIQEIHRVLKPNGTVVFFAPDFRSFKLDFWEADYTHGFIVTAYRLTMMLQDAGFSIPIKKRLYANLDFFPGWFIDRIVNMGCEILRLAFPFNFKIVKAQMMFHGNILLVGKKLSKSIIG